MFSNFTNFNADGFKKKNSPSIATGALGSMVANNLQTQAFNASIRAKQTDDQLRDNMISSSDYYERQIIHNQVSLAHAQKQYSHIFQNHLPKKRQLECADYFFKKVLITKVWLWF